MRGRRAASRAETGPTPDPAEAFEGLPALVEGGPGVSAQAARARPALDEARRRATASPRRSSREVNDALTRVERAFLLPDGLPGRPWFKHAIYAPGLTTGYACLAASRASARPSRRTSPSGSSRWPPQTAARIDRAAAALAKVREQIDADPVGPRLRTSGLVRSRGPCRLGRNLSRGERLMDSHGRPASMDRPRLPRVLGPVEAFCVVVGSVIGSGIFLVPASVARDVPYIGGIVLVWVVGGSSARPGR